MPLNSRQKGTGGERELAAAYREAGFDCARTPNSGGLHIKGDVVGVPGLHVEAKRTERLRLFEALKQAEREAPADAIPALHFRRNRDGWYVALRFEDFLEVYGEYLRLAAAA